jgi:MFS family permease
MSSKDSPADAWSDIGLAGKLALVAAGTFPSIGLFSLSPAQAAIQSNFQTTPNVSLMVQIIVGMVAPLFAIASPFAGRLVGRHGVRAVYLGSIVLFVIGGLGPMICPSLVSMLPFRVILALGIAGAATAGYAGVARVPEKQRQILLGMMSFVGGAITIFAFPIVGMLAAQDWSLAFLVHLIVIPLGLFAFALPKPDAVSSSQDHAPTGGKLAGVPLALLAIAMVGGWGMVASSIYSPVYLGSIGVTDTAKVGNLLAIMSLCSLAGSGSYGFVHRFVGTRAMLMLGLAFCTAACAVIASSSSIPGVTIGLALLGAGLAAFSAAAYASAIEAVGQGGNVSGAMGVMNLALFGPQILFPPLATNLGAMAGPPAVYVMMAGCLALCLAALAFRPLPVARPVTQPAG